MSSTPNGIFQVHAEFMKIACGKCGNCVANYQGGEIAIRHKDFFVFAMGGIVVVNCRLCARPNLIVSEEYERSHPEVVKKARESFFMTDGSLEPWIPKSRFEKGQ